MKSFIKLHAPLIVWASAILIVSSIPYMQTPDLGFSLEDKLAHFVEYFILGILIFRSLSTGSLPIRRLLLLTLLYGTVFAAIDEAHQLFIPGRFATWTDFLADSLGIILSLPFGVWLRKVKEIS